MKSLINQGMSSSICAVLILQLALPVQAAWAGGATYGAKISDLKANQISGGAAPKNTPDYIESLCNGIEDASDGTVQVKDTAGVLQTYNLATACKTPSGKQSNDLKISCTLYEAANTSQVKSYCDARWVAKKARSGVDFAYKMDIAAAAACWGEWLMIKAQKSNVIGAGASAGTSNLQGKICGTAAMASGLAEVTTTAVMLFRNKGKKVGEDGSVNARDDLTLYGGMIASMGIGVLGVNYGRCLMNIGGGCEKVGGEGKTGGGGGLSNIGDIVGKGKELLDTTRNPAGKEEAPVTTSAPPTQPNYNGTGGTRQNKWDYNPILPGESSPPGGHYRPKSDPVISPIEIITAFSRENSEFRETIIQTLEGDSYDRWKRDSFQNTFARMSLEAPSTLLACNALTEVDLGGGKCLPKVSKTTTVKPVTVQSTLKSMNKTHNYNMQTGEWTKKSDVQMMIQNNREYNKSHYKTDNMGNPLKDANGKNVELNSTEKMIQKANSESRSNGTFASGSTGAKEKKAPLDAQDKERLIMKAALAFTALAAMRYMTRNNAKKTQENAEHFLASMISSIPVVAGSSGITAGGGFRAGNGYVGGGTTTNNGDRSGIVDSGPEGLLAPRGSPQREAFEKIASQIPDSVVDGPGGVSGAIGAVAGAMGGDGKSVAAVADDASDRALAALGASTDIYATEGGGGGGKKSSDGGGLNLNLGGMGEAPQEVQADNELAFRKPASSCTNDIYHSSCPSNVFEIISHRISQQPIAQGSNKAL